ncbi:MAG: HNH endonuclease [Rhodobacteraceae bacterium]|nr:MAG: HNH endonuclease [Paracoccaceae bacterium]
MNFADLLLADGFDPKQVKLLRHDTRGLLAWKKSPDHFLSFASVQAAETSPFQRNPRWVAHFLPGPRLQTGGFSAYFVGLAELLERRPWDDSRPPRYWLEDYRVRGVTAEAADQEWVSGLPHLEQGLCVDWGLAPRSWHQWGSQSKPVIGGSGPSLDEMLDGAGKSILLDAENRLALTIEYEDKALSRQLGRNLEKVRRSAEERRLGLVRQRPDQVAFRNALVERHGPRCSITGCDVLEALEAAHIIPFAKETTDRNLPSNGLLLRRDIHRLFDLFLISVDPATREILLSSKIAASAYGALSGVALNADVSSVAVEWHYRQFMA